MSTGITGRTCDGRQLKCADTKRRKLRAYRGGHKPRNQLFAYEVSTTWNKHSGFRVRLKLLQFSTIMYISRDANYASLLQAADHLRCQLIEAEKKLSETNR